jgi:hypothetical protein
MVGVPPRSQLVQTGGVEAPEKPMSSASHSVWNLGLLLGLLGVMCLVSSSLIWLSIELRDVVLVLRTNQEAIQRGEELSRLLGEANCYHRIRLRLVQEIIEGRTTLLQAASVFRYLEDRSSAPGKGWSSSDGATPEERSCRDIIRRLQMLLESDHVSKDLPERLEAELDRHLNSPEGLQLPAVTAEEIPELRLLDGKSAFCLSDGSTS